MSEADKTRFLVVYDYGTGGVWSYVWARSVADIDRKFRDLKAIETPPSWMTADEQARIEEQKTYDIDTIEPSDWIARLLRHPI